jgi:hypothetical protein
MAPRLRSLKLRALTALAPKGPNKTAQGRAMWRFATSAALGRRNHNKKQALKGRHKFGAEILCRPFRAWILCWNQRPRASLAAKAAALCPGLIC